MLGGKPATGPLPRTGGGVRNAPLELGSRSVDGKPSSSRPPGGQAKERGAGPGPPQNQSSECWSPCASSITRTANSCASMAAGQTARGRREIGTEAPSSAAQSPVSSTDGGVASNAHWLPIVPDRVVTSPWRGCTLKWRLSPNNVDRNRRSGWTACVHASLCTGFVRRSATRE